MWRQARRRSCAWGLRRERCPRRRESLLPASGDQQIEIKTYYVYLLASKKNGTLYAGVTGNLFQRVWQHKNDVHEGFTRRCSVHRLVWFEATTDVQAALLREKQIKKWRRQWKINLIEEENPNWDDLHEELI